MIAYLKGNIRELQQDTVILDVNGVGYEVHCSQNTMNAVTSNGGITELFIHTHVREDALQLFGFATALEKELFLSLNKVNGIGPKMAMKVLSGASTENLVTMIENENVTELSRLPKVGKKTAEQMILALKGKLVFENTKAPVSGHKKDILSALVNLGFKLTEAEKVVGTMPAEIDVAEGIKQGLQSLSHL